MAADPSVGSTSAETDPPKTADAVLHLDGETDQPKTADAVEQPGGAGTLDGGESIDDSGDERDPSTDGDDPGVPMLQISDSALEFGRDLSELTFTVQNAGGGVLAYKITPEVDWVDVQPNEGEVESTADVITARINREALELGQHTALILIEADTGETGTVQVLAETPPRLALSTYALDFGSSEKYLSFTLRNDDSEPLNYALTASVDWLDVLSSEGELRVQEDTVVWAEVNRCYMDWDAGLNHAELIVETGSGEVHAIAVTVEVPEWPSRDQVAGWLESLPPLPKVHYSYPVNAWRLGVVDQHAAAYHWVRITRSLGLNARWVTEELLRAAVALCQRVNDENPGVNATLALNYDPYHYVFPWGEPPTYDGPGYLEELALCQDRMTLVRSWLDQANADFGADVRVSSILLDCEPPGWNTHEQGEPDALVWQAALREKYDVIYLICKGAFPDTYVDWFNRGMPCCKRRFTTEELGDSYSRAAYWMDNLPLLRADYRETHDLAQADGVERLLVWLAPGGGWIEPPDGVSPKTWACDLEYDTSHSWQLGAEVNDPWYSLDPDTYAPWDAVDAVAFYPGAGDVRIPRFFRHFTDYVRGAHGLPPLE